MILLFMLMVPSEEKNSQPTSEKKKTGPSTNLKTPAVVKSLHINALKAVCPRAAVPGERLLVSIWLSLPQ